jgi:pyridoxine 4-dehydrogenase
MGIMADDTRPAERSGTFTIGGDLPVHRLGFGAMRITGEGIWGPPRDPAEALRVLRRALQLGITFIDTADSYGPEVSERLIAQALHPYPPELVIATKAGFRRPGPGQWREDGRPEYLRERVHGSLERLRLDRIDLLQLHRIDSKVPVADQIGALTRLQEEGKIRHIGLSEVTVDQVREVQTLVQVATVQNLYNLSNRKSENVLDFCESEGIGFIPWFPLATGSLAAPGGPLATVAERLQATPSQVALAWLLHRSPVMLPIPGTSTVTHLEENTGAALLSLDEVAVRQLDRQQD